VKPKLILIRFGELALKGRATRLYYEKILLKNIRGALKENEISFSLNREWGRIFLYTDKIQQSIDILRHIFGIYSISPAIKTISNIDAMTEFATDFATNTLNSHRSFALRVNRVGKHLFTSQDVAIKLGDEIVKTTGAKVDLTKPDIELFIEIRDENAYFFLEKYRGPGGMPLGTQGKLLVLVSSKNSLLSAWLVMRRGCNIAIALTNESLVEAIDNFTKKWYTKPKIISIDFSESDNYTHIEEMANKIGCGAIVTDHTLNHENNQKIIELGLMKKQISLPILHPLIAMNEDEIENRLKNIEVL
jgi:thiamine biosynthesis protein ThiI